MIINGVEIIGRKKPTAVFSSFAALNIWNNGIMVATCGTIIARSSIENNLSFHLSWYGNLLWFIFGGCISGLSWMLAGCLWCISIIGIPYGIQCFKFASMSFFPFGKEIVYGGGAVSFIVNVIWILISGIPLAVEHLVIGCLLCVTIIGIPFGLQQFKLAKLALMPFGTSIVYTNHL